MTWYGKTRFLFYGEKTIAKYKFYCINGNDCEIELELFNPFHHQRVYLNNISMTNADKAVLDYMTLQAYCDTDDCNKLQAYEVVEYFKNQINKEGK